MEKDWRVKIKGNLFNSLPIMVCLFVCLTPKVKKGVDFFFFFFELWFFPKVVYILKLTNYPARLRRHVSSRLTHEKNKKIRKKKVVCFLISLLFSN